MTSWKVIKTNFIVWHWILHTRFFFLSPIIILNILFACILVQDRQMLHNLLTATILTFCQSKKPQIRKKDTVTLLIVTMQSITRRNSVLPKFGSHFSKFQQTSLNKCLRYFSNIIHSFLLHDYSVVTRAAVFTPKPTSGTSADGSSQILPTAWLQEPGRTEIHSLLPLICSQHY